MSHVYSILGQKEEKAFFMYLSVNTSVAVWVADKKLEGKLLDVTTNAWRTFIKKI